MKEYLLEREQWLPRPLERVFSFFADARNLGAITPSWLGFRIHDPIPEKVELDTRIEYTIRIARVRYALPFGLLGRGVHWLAIQAMLARIFDYRFAHVRDRLGRSD